MSTLEQALEALSARVATLEQTTAETAAATGAGTMTHKEFFDLFTMVERLRWRDLIDTSAQTSVASRTPEQTLQLVSYDYFIRARGLRLDDQSTVAGVMYLRAWGVLDDDARVTAVLAGDPQAAA
ncbi:hypothetical protein [Oceanicaulis sp.]|uniref:hypothetical protein n=1 Tax=Oceanicaulis sp. TaxID=1924941 RepID=UPI003F711B25